MCLITMFIVMFFFCNQKTAYELRISDWSSDVCSYDLNRVRGSGGRDRHGILQHMPAVLNDAHGGVTKLQNVRLRRVELERDQPSAVVMVLDRPNELQPQRSEEHTSELQSLMRISYAVFCLKKNNKKNDTQQINLL